MLVEDSACNECGGEGQDNRGRDRQAQGKFFFKDGGFKGTLYVVRNEPGGKGKVHGEGEQWGRRRGEGEVKVGQYGGWQGLESRRLMERLARTCKQWKGLRQRW